jgi:hypothetical protein
MISRRFVLAKRRMVERGAMRTKNEAIELTETLTLTGEVDLQLAVTVSSNCNCKTRTPPSQSCMMFGLGGKRQNSFFIAALGMP